MIHFTGPKNVAISRGIRTMAILFIHLVTSQVAVAMETTISVDCESDPEHMLVKVRTDEDFRGQVYASGHLGEPLCTAKGQGPAGNNTTLLRLPFHGCNTTQKRPGLFMNKVIVQQHGVIVSAGDGEYDVACQMFYGDLTIQSRGATMDSKGVSPEKGKVSQTVAPPNVQLRVYDYENEVFLDTVQLGQVVELEVTIRDGNIYKGRVTNCDAFGGQTKIPVIRNL